MVDPKTAKDIADVASSIVPVKQVYEDALQPAVRQVGKGLETVAKLIHVALAPLAMIIWGYEKIRDYLEPALAERLKYVPPDRIKTPAPNVAGPAIEALRFTAHDDDLREMYANLLATAMDSRVAESAHPSFVDVLKQLTPDEAKIMGLFALRATYPVILVRSLMDGGEAHVNILRNFSLLGSRAKCSFPTMDQMYLDNLCRLGLISVPHDTHLVQDEMYKELTEHKFVKECEAQIALKGGTPNVQKQVAVLTEMGRRFLQACVIRPEPPPDTSAP